MFRKQTNTVNQNVVQIWGNKESMNLNSMILTNIQTSNYYKQKLSELKTYHELIDEIYYRVTHLEPWEKGSRRTQGLTGMCGGVRGVGGGGIVSTCFCLLYKLYTLKLSRKQLIGLMTHADSPYIRALGFLYVRYTQDPKDLMWWYGDYLDDEEEIDVKAGGGNVMQIGNMLRQWLTRLEWYDTLFPRIPVPIQNEIIHELRDRYGTDRVVAPPPVENRSRERSRSPRYYRSRSRERSRERSRSPPRYRSRSRSTKKRRNSKDERSKRNRSSSASSDRSGVLNGNKKESSRHHERHKKSSNSRRDERETSQERKERRQHRHDKKSGHRKDREASSERERHHKSSNKEKDKRSRSPEKRRRDKSTDSVQNRKDSKADYLKKYRNESD